MWVLWVSIIVAVLDQVTKELIRAKFIPGMALPVIPNFFDLTHIRNPGAAWGILGGQNTALTALSIVLLAVMIIFRRSFLSNTWEHRLALGLLAGGVIGNLMDRLRLGAVTDFLDFHWYEHHFPSFNVADSAICIGVGLYILSSFWLKSHPLNGNLPVDSAVPEEKAVEQGTHERGDS